MSNKGEADMTMRMVCTTCGSDVPAAPYCARCGAVLQGAAGVFTEAASVSTYSEAAPEHASGQDEVLARLGLIATPTTPEAAPLHAESGAEAPSTPDPTAPSTSAGENLTLSALATPVSATAEVDELDAALARTTTSTPPLPETARLSETATATDPSVVEESTPVSSRRGWRAHVARWWWAVAAGVLLLVLLSGLVLVAVAPASDTPPPSSQESPSPTAPTQAGPLPGYAAEELWGAAAERAVVSADGNRVLVVYPTGKGTTAQVREVKNGKPVASVDVAEDAVPVVAGKTLLVRAGGTVSAWGPGAVEPATIPAPDSAKVLVRSGTGFLLEGATATVFTDTGLVSVNAPRAGMVPLGYQPDTQTVVWASATGHLVTGAVTGTVVHDVALVAPTADAIRSGWLAANDTFAFLTWTTPAGPILAVHLLADGSVTAYAPITGEAIVSPSGKTIASPGAVVDADTGALVAETGFVPAVFLNDDELYGTTPAGLPALWHAGKVTGVTAGALQPIAITAHGLVVSDTHSVMLFPPTKN